MDLYRINGRYVGTQADARAEAKTAGVRFDPDKHSEKVPTDKAGLISYLNGLAADIAANHPATAPVGLPAGMEDANRRVDESRPAPSAAKSREAQLIELEEAIQSANGFELSSLLGNVVSRLEELRREARLPTSPSL